MPAATPYILQRLQLMANGIDIHQPFMMQFELPVWLPGRRLRTKSIA